MGAVRKMNVNDIVVGDTIRRRSGELFTVERILTGSVSKSLAFSRGERNRGQPVRAVAIDTGPIRCRSHDGGRIRCPKFGGCAIRGQPRPDHRVYLHRDWLKPAAMQKSRPTGLVDTMGRFQAHPSVRGNNGATGRATSTPPDGAPLPRWSSRGVSAVWGLNVCRYDYP